MTRAQSSRGSSIVEAMVAMSVVAIGMGAALTLLDRGLGHSRQADAAHEIEDTSRGALAGLFDLLAETAVSHVDTSMRVHLALGVIDFTSDRFTIPGCALVQCTSPVCGFHTRADLSTMEPRLVCGFEYRAGLGSVAVTRGKVCPGQMSTCPFDGSGVNASAALDGMKFFVARDSGGAFTAAADGGPFWSGLVLVFPCPTPDGLTELRRYDVYVSDLLAAVPTKSLVFTRFDPNNPSLVDLFDFGTDGTIDGIPDGSVPVTAVRSDAATETFVTTLDEGEPAILFLKVLGTQGVVYPYRRVELRVKLATGETDFTVSHYDTALTFWSATASFTRTPRTLVRNLTEFSVSTAASNPFDPVGNPSGFPEPRMVRIALGTSAPPRSDSTQWMHHVETFSVKTRN